MLRINRAPGKSEAMLTYRGKQAGEHREVRHRNDGKLWIKLPVGTDRSHLSVVTHFKHMGGYVSAGGSTFEDAVHRVKRAMAAYGPLADKVFAATSVNESTKVHLAGSLIFSRLL
ncbi:unnamed protein product [Polarella glacialis]|uniref:Uncharacterized protein n=1 Tax=Polarella glacialis TaxID=89957 RepID=A0A813L060_POLGL|nr:unnamed protein product [Polarella glacialis]